MTGTVTLRPIQSAVAEVNVLTTTLPAEYGHSAGGVITSVSKTGTNTFHGMASAYGRWRNMQHKNYFDVNRQIGSAALFCRTTPIMFLQPDAYGGGPLSYFPSFTTVATRHSGSSLTKSSLTSRQSNSPGLLPRQL